MNCRRMSNDDDRDDVMSGAAPSAIPEVYRDTLTALGLLGDPSD